MTWLRVLVSRLAALFRREEREKELNEELRSHLDMLVKENLRQGMPPDEARCAALRSFGGVEQMKESYREQRGLPIMETLAQDVRFGLRQLRRNPGFTLVAMLTLALGIGANTAIFSVVNAVVLRPLPYRDSQRLVWIVEAIPAFKAEVASGADYVDWKDQNRTLDAITAYDESGSFNLTGRSTPARVHAAVVSASFFRTLGVDPQLGRGFTPEEDRPNGPKAVVLMHAFWRQYFGADSGVLGLKVNLDGIPYTVVGVMPASFRFPGGADAQMLVPLALDEATERLRVRNRIVQIIGRLKPGVSLEGARADLDAIRKRSQSAAMAGGPIPAPAPSPGGGSMRTIVAESAPTPPSGVAPAMPPRGGGLAVFVPPAHAGRPPQRQAGGAAVAPVPPLPMGGAPPGGPVRMSPGIRPGGPGGPGGPAGPGFRPFAPPEVELRVVPLGEHLAGKLRPIMLIMLAAVGLVLLIACANVANLMLTRVSLRTREVAVRAALGAGRWRVVRQLLTESALLALGGGLAGLALAAWGVGALADLIPPDVGGEILSLVGARVDSGVLLFTFGVSVLTGVLFGLAPALAATRFDLAERLKESASAAGGSNRSGLRRGGLLRGGLAVAELSLALVLLTGAGLLSKSFYRVLSIDPGFAPERVLTLDLSLAGSKYPNPQAQRAFFSEVLRRVESLPGVRSAALADSLPLSPYRAKLGMMIRRETAAATLPDAMTLMSRVTVSPAYFYTLGIPVLEGRTFTDADNAGAAKVAVVNQTLARHLWPGENPIGKQLPLLGDTISVVGVVGDTRHEGLSEEVGSEFCVPFLQETHDSMQLAVRAAGDPVSLAAAIRAQIAAVDPDQPVYHLSTLEQTLSESVAPRRFNMLLLGIFAALALALAAVGIYGVMAFSVAQRTHEIGIRMALGAERRQVLRLIVGQALGLTAAGVVLGIAGAWALTRFLSGFLYGVRPTDPATFALVAAVLVAVSSLASYLPARRATKVDPMVALRCE